MPGRSSIAARTVFAVCFLALMTVLGVSAVFAYAEDFLSSPTAGETIESDVAAVTSFREIYPFDTVTADKPVEKFPGAANLRLFAAYQQTVRNKKDTVEIYSARKVPLLRFFHRQICAWDQKIGNNLIENGDLPIVRLDNGYLTYAFVREDSSNLWETMLDWNTWLQKRNIPLLQIIPATKMDDGISTFPSAVLHSYARWMEQYKAFLTENHIPYLETKDVLLANNKDFYSWFYKTDHHWNVFAGRLIAETTAKKLHEKFGIATDADAVKEVNFKLTRYPSIFCGTMALKAGAFPEDIEIFYLRKKTLFHLQIPSMGIDRTGDFNDVLIARPYLNLPNSYFCFLYGSRPLIQIENKACHNGTRILMVKESQANVVCPYLACAVQYLDVIDPRHFDGNIKAFIERTNPDVVLICI